MTLRKRIVVVGGGAAGMMAAFSAKEVSPLAEVLLIEKNDVLGAKVMISGGGRCNVTTGITQVKDVLRNYPRGAKFLMSAMFRFPPDKVREWFEERGVPMKVEEDLRVFPRSNKGADVVGVLEKALRGIGVDVRLKAGVVGAEKIGQKFRLRLSDDQTLEADVLILTTGGNAYHQTGSTGDGYAFARALGHTVTQLAPSLSSFVVAESSLVKEIAGISFQKAVVKLVSFDGKRSFERRGPFVFTHFGVSGPAAFAVSSMAAYEKYGKDVPMKLSLDLFPDETAEQLESRMMGLAGAHGKKLLINFLDFILPRSMCSVVLEYCSLPADLHVGRLSREHRKQLIAALKAFTLMVVGRGAGDEFVTAGGVDLREVNTNTMESRICPGLFFAGEILDVDGFTGGFNLQASWATGKLAGESAGKYCAEL